ncbi:unnamed protein product [Chrysoparadoxa australica]
MLRAGKRVEGGIGRKIWPLLILVAACVCRLWLGRTKRDDACMGITGSVECVEQWWLRARPFAPEPVWQDVVTAGWCLLLLGLLYILETRLGASVKLRSLQDTISSPSSCTPSLLYRQTPLNKKLASLPCLSSPYYPPPWAPTSMGIAGHMQSAMFCMYCPPRHWRAISHMTSVMQPIKCSYDGGHVPVTWWEPEGIAFAEDAPVVLMLPGVCGQPDNMYVKRMALALAERLGWRTVVKGWRGFGFELTTPRPETWDEVALQDTLDVIQMLREKVGPKVPIYGVGHSYGGCLLTTLVGAYPASKHMLSGVVSISGLFDFQEMMRHIASEWDWLYDHINTKMTLKNHERFKVVDALCGQGNLYPGGYLDITNIKGHREFHKRFTIPYTQDDSVDCYLDRLECMTRAGFGSVNVPVLALLSKDDPLCPPKVWGKALKAASGNDYIIVVQTEWGGHCGWFSGMSGDSWLDDVAVEFLRTILEEQKAQDASPPPTARRGG